MNFEFATATRIVFGPGTLAQAGAAARAMGRRALVVHGSTPDRAAPLLAALDEHGIGCELFGVAGEPTTWMAREGTDLARSTGCNVVIGFGGGSVLDAAKAIAILLTNGGDPYDYLEVIGRGQGFTQPAAPFIAIPTTAGTGTEVTSNAVLASPEHRVKVSLRSPLMLARLALVDPELTYSLPPGITAASGLDALTQVIEPFVSHKANPLTDAICREGIRLVSRSLRRAVEHGDDTQAREDMAVAALFGGLALSNAKLGAVHGFAGPLGGMFPAPHGAVCGRLLPYATAVNVRALEQRAPDSEALRRYDEVARIVTGNAQATAHDAVAWASDLGAALSVPPLSTYGITPADLPVLVEKAAVSSSMQGNPIRLTPEEMTEILTMAL